MASSPAPVLKNAWSAATLFAGINAMDEDCLKLIKQELPDDPEQLEKLHQVGPRLYGFHKILFQLVCNHFCLDVGSMLILNRT